MDRQVLTAPESFKRFLDGHAPSVAMSQDRRENQCLAGVTQENAKRQRRNDEALDPNEQATRDTCHATRVTTHERLFPFNDNFTVVRDLSEDQRKRLTSSLSLR